MQSPSTRRYSSGSILSIINARRAYNKIEKNKQWKE